MRKSTLAKMDEVKHILIERDILTATKSPWLVRLLYAFQDPLHVFLAMVRGILSAVPHLHVRICLPFYDGAPLIRNSCLAVTFALCSTTLASSKKSTLAFTLLKCSYLSTLSTPLATSTET